VKLDVLDPAMLAEGLGQAGGFDYVGVVHRASIPDASLPLSVEKRS
jgi:hypothetical protein